MRLTDLEPQFVVREDERTQRHVDTLSEAQGLYFLCPKCFAANGGSVGTHSVCVWFKERGVPDSETPGPGRWPASGTGYGDLTLTGSVLLTTGCGWHGFVTDGQVTP